MRRRCRRERQESIDQRVRGEWEQEQEGEEGEGLQEWRERRYLLVIER